jgi:glycosyltransferase involved in cell wall biosynthesis
MTKQNAPYTIGFLLEQTLGHITHSANLQTNVPGDPAVYALWGLIPWETRGVAARLPGYRSNWTIRAGILARRALAKMQREAKLDALFIHTQVPAVLLPDWLSQVPSVVSLDATPCQYDALGNFYGHQKSAGWLEQQKLRLNRLCFQRAQHLVTWSHWTAKSLTTDYGIPAEKITVIPPGVNVDAWQPHIPHIVDKRVKILFVGGDLQRKGGYDLLEAARYLRAELDSAGSRIQLELHLVTRADVPQEPGLFVYRDMQPNSTELKALFHACDLFCLPTLGDCLPMVLSEAGAAGLPMIATDVGAINEIVKDGNTGFLIAPSSITALVEALRILVLQPNVRLRLGENAQMLVRNQYDAVRNTHRLLELLKTIADEAKASRSMRATAHIRIGQGHG